MEFIIGIFIVVVIVSVFIIKKIRKKKSTPTKGRPPHDFEDVSFYPFLERVGKMKFATKAEFEKFIYFRSDKISVWMKSPNFRTAWLPLKERILKELE